MGSIQWDKERCILCGGCVAVCPSLAIVLHTDDLEILRDKCSSCSNCVVGCPMAAMSLEERV